ncbi:MAG TPA: hypothetical protein PKZ76_04835 [Xanthomonadaceae bacterium]|nr:hypothetical protein [Xanthomonadaceae bacterium]
MAVLVHVQAATRIVVQHHHALLILEAVAHLVAGFALFLAHQRSSFFGNGNSKAIAASPR